MRHLDPLRKEMMPFSQGVQLFFQLILLFLGLSLLALYPTTEALSVLMTGTVILIIGAYQATDLIATVRDVYLFSLVNTLHLAAQRRGLGLVLSAGLGVISIAVYVNVESLSVRLVAALLVCAVFPLWVLSIRYHQRIVLYRQLLDSA